MAVRTVKHHFACAIGGRSFVVILAFWSYPSHVESDPDELITTGQAAQLLGCSRQHVVDLCERGDFDFQTTSVHRRLRRGDVQAFARRRHGMTREELRSLWLNRAVAARL